MCVRARDLRTDEFEGEVSRLFKQAPVSGQQQYLLEHGVVGNQDISR